MTALHRMLATRLRVLKLSAFILALPLVAAAPATAEIIKKEDLLRGVTMTAAQCAKMPQTAWVRVYGRDFCVRYYMSNAGGEGVRPVVFLQGDQLGALDEKTWAWKDATEAKDIDTDNLMEMAHSFSRMVKTTAIYLARIGVDGTSGNHVARKTMLELNLMNAALDAIKRQHGFEGFHLAGQSGGATLVGSLIRMRSDVSCAVPGSGRLAALTDAPTKADPGGTFFDPAAGIAELARKPKLRLLVVTDAADKRVPAKHQVTFVERLRLAGGHVDQLFVEATDQDHHGVLEYTRLVMSGCVLGKSTTEIARAVGTLVKRNAAWNAVRAAEANPKPAPSGIDIKKSAGSPRTPAAGPAAAPVRRGTEAKGGIGLHAALTVHNLGDAVHWDFDLACQLGCTESEVFEFFGEISPG